MNASNCYMELDPQLQKALDKLARGGEKIGEPTTLGEHPKPQP